VVPEHPARAASETPVKTVDDINSFSRSMACSFS